MIDPAKEKDSESKLKFTWKGFREPKPTVTVQCDEAEACPEKLHTVQHLSSLPKDLQHLAQLVANPEAKEAVWLNACVAAGNRSLVPTKSKIPLASGLLAALGATFSFIVLLLSFLTALLLSSDTAFLFSQVDPNVFLQGLIDSHIFGLIVALCSGFAFWCALLVQNLKLRRFLVGSSLLTLFGMLQIAAFDFFDFPVALAVSAMAVVATGTLATFATFCREALPKTFQAADVAKSAIGVLFLPVALTCLMVAVGLSHDFDSSQSFSKPTVDSLSFSVGVLFFAVFGQSLALARATKSSSRAACILLASCVQGPLLLGTIFTAVASTAKSIAVAAGSMAGVNWGLSGSPIQAWAQYGNSKALYSLEVAALIMIFIAAGSLLGAKMNAAKANSNPEV